jgi:hypothetical protein
VSQQMQVTTTPQNCCLIIKILFPSNYGIFHACSLYLYIYLSRILVVANISTFDQTYKSGSYKITTFLYSLVFESLAVHEEAIRN